MSLSQFKVYASGDEGAPWLTGTTGSMVKLLDACLVNGYGTKTPVGWLKPIPNISSSVAGYIGAWQQPSGSGFYLVVNDSPPSGSLSGSRHPSSWALGTTSCWAIGWERLLGLTGSYGTGSTGQVGSGSGQFPTPGLVGLTDALSSSGSVNWAKSDTGNTYPRPWVMFADAYTFYLFVQPGTADDFAYSLYGFGDFYSYKPTPDTYKCFIMGRSSMQTSNVQSVDPNWVFTQVTAVSTAQFYVARSYTGFGSAIGVNRVGDTGKANLDLGASGYTPMRGVCRTVSGRHNFMSKIEVAEGNIGSIRGLLRGLYSPSLRASQIVDGMVISGSNEDNGKLFRCVWYGGTSAAAGGAWAVDISPNIPTNDF